VRVRRSGGPVEELSEGFEEFGFRAESMVEAGSHVVALGRMYGRGCSTGIETEIPLGIVFTRGADGKLVRYESFRNPNQALESVGLSERDARR
jgi:hypothetical protein